MKEQSLYTKYDLLLPSKFDGGYLIIALYEKIKNREIEVSTPLKADLCMKYAFSGVDTLC